MQFTRRSKQLRCLSNQLVTTGALQPEAERPRATLTGAVVHLAAILLVIATALYAAGAIDSCSNAPGSPPFTERG